MAAVVPHNAVDVTITFVGLIFDAILFIDIISKLVELTEYHIELKEYHVELKINKCRSYYMVLKNCRP